MPRISPETIEQVAAALNIVDVIGSYFPLKRAGVEFRALCPFHQEKTPSFYVNPGKQTFYCFGCGRGGSVFQFVQEYEHIDFPEAVRRLAHRAAIPIIEAEPSPEEQEKQTQRKRLLACISRPRTGFTGTCFAPKLAKSLALTCAGANSISR